MASLVQASTRAAHRHFFPLCFSAGAVLSILVLSRRISSQKLNNAPSVIPSPRDTVLPTLSKEQTSALPYPPDALPGARDVATPYGSIRVYEWGPEDGRRVVMLHGISTPCIALSGLAHRLVEKGCRVMLFDLFGRGYSASPRHLPHDYCLYTSQLLLVLASSRLSWPSFALLGYSFGGALAANFTSLFPHLVSGLILIAPGGLLREAHISWKSRVLYANPGVLPRWWIERLVARRLHSGEVASRSMEPEPAPVHLSSAWKNEVYVKDKDKGERGISSPSLYTSSNSPLLPTHTSSTVSRVVDWQISHHPAFVPAFISSIQHTPVHGQCAAWAKIGERLHHQNGCASDPEAQALGLEGGKVLVLLGSRDEIVVASEVGYDVKRVLGKGNVEVHVLEAGHEVPIERIGECAEAVGGYLGL